MTLDSQPVTRNPQPVTRNYLLPIQKLAKGNILLKYFVPLRQRFRGVAQLASVLAWGASGREFESHHSDFSKA